MRKINQFLQVCLGISLIILSITAFLNTIQPAQADEKNLVNSEEELTIENAKNNTTGKIMMSESGFVYNNTLLYHILVWDTETGKSKLYNYSKNNKSFVGSSYQIPKNPLP